MHPPDEYDCITPLYSFVDELICYSLISARASVAGLLTRAPTTLSLWVYALVAVPAHEQKQNNAGQNGRRALPEQNRVALDERGCGGVEIFRIGMTKIERILR